MEWDVGKAPAEPPRSVRLTSSSVCPRPFTGHQLTRWVGWGSSGVLNLRDGDGGDVHVGAQPLRVLNGVHHPSRLPGAAEPWLTLPSRAHGAVARLHPWVILVFNSPHVRRTDGFVTVTQPGKPLIARACSLLLQVVPRGRASLWQQEFPGCQKGDFCQQSWISVSVNRCEGQTSTCTGVVLCLSLLGCCSSAFQTVNVRCYRR